MSTSNTFGWRTVLVVFLTVLLLSTATSAQDSYPERKLIAIQSNSDEFRQIVDAIRDPSSTLIPDTDLKRSDIYFRLTERRFVLTDDNTLKDNPYLGGKPYVFLTVPQAAYGRSLYEIYSDLGYDAEGILKQRNKTMVALVLRYKDDIKFSQESEGNGPLAEENFKKYAYVPTWENGFALFSRLAGETLPPNINDDDLVLYMTFKPDEDRDTAQFFPAERRAHIALLPYPVLRMAGGPDWDYRQLLENYMGMNSHFRGVGITENTLSPSDNRKGLPEFVGPNRQLQDLQDYAVIDLGRMEFKEVHN